MQPAPAHPDRQQAVGEQHQGAADRPHQRDQQQNRHRQPLNTGAAAAADREQRQRKRQGEPEQRTTHRQVVESEPDQSAAAARYEDSIMRRA